ncbi:MAG: 30S processome protein Utp24 [Candidatus Bathyarchaeia archaeon]
MDSNFLFIPVQFNIDIFDEMERILAAKVEPILPLPVLEELKSLAVGGSPKVRRQASSALKLAQRCKSLEVSKHPGESVDDFILRVASGSGLVVATTDRELRKRLRNISIPVIYLRDRSHLAVEGGGLI